MDTIWLGSDNQIRLDDFSNMITGDRIESGTVVAKLYDDSEVGGPTQLGSTITMGHASNGLWIGILNDDHVDLAVGMTVRIECTANGGSGLLLFKSILGIVRTLE